MAKRRERLEIIKDILNSIQNNRNIRYTRLLHISNLSPQMFNDYVNELIEKKLIKECKDSKFRYFILTDKGSKFIKEYQILLNVIRNFGL